MKEILTPNIINKHFFLHQCVSYAINLSIKYGHKGQITCRLTLEDSDRTSLRIGKRKSILCFFSQANPREREKVPDRQRER